MTIKKLALSTVAAAMVTTGALAGTLTAVSQTVGAEGVAKDAAMLRTDLNTSYTVSILGTLNQGSVIYNITNVDFNDTTDIAAFNVYDSTSATLITSSCASGSAGQIICDINDTITSGDTLILAPTASATDKGVALDVNVSAGFTISAVSTQLTNSATTLIDSGSAATTLSTVTEWSAAITTPFANQIDASNDFLSFTSASDANATLTISQTTVDVSSNALSATWRIIPDQNVSTFGTMNMTGGGVTQTSDNNYTTGVNPAASGVYQADFTPDGTNAIQEATFTTLLKSTFGTNVVNLLPSTTSFGSFTTYGYTAQIPGASYSAGTTDTTITLVNTGTSDTTDAVVTIQDATGTACSLTSASASEVTKPTSGTSTKMKLSEMLGNTACSALTGTSFSIELSVPTTPTNIYANAFVKNSSINQFKVLPVYNNGNSY